MTMENDIASLNFCGGGVRYIDLPSGRHYAVSDVWRCLGYGDTLSSRRQATKAKGEFVKFGRLMVAKREHLADVFGLKEHTALRAAALEKIKALP